MRTSAVSAGVSLTHRLWQVFQAYADKKSVDLATLRFMTPDGDRIKPGSYDKTVNDLGLEDDECIGAHSPTRRHSTSGLILSQTCSLSKRGEPCECGMSLANGNSYASTGRTKYDLA
jgi:hypothetical protein